MPREIHASVEDDVFRRVKIAAAESDVTISAVLRSLVGLFVEDPKVRERVIERADPDGRRRPPTETD